jgi:hypothetical protein
VAARPPERPRRVNLRSEHDGEDHRYLDAHLDQDGNLHLDGQDLGPGTAPVSSDGEYEYFKAIAAADIPALLALLDAPGDVSILDELERHWTGAQSHELETRIRNSGFPFTFSCWSG